MCPLPSSPISTSRARPLGTNLYSKVGFWEQFCYVSQTVLTDKCVLGQEVGPHGFLHPWRVEKALLTSPPPARDATPSGAASPAEASPRAGASPPAEVTQPDRVTPTKGAPPPAGVAPTDGAPPPAGVAPPDRAPPPARDPRCQESPLRLHAVRPAQTVGASLPSQGPVL